MNQIDLIRQRHREWLTLSAEEKQRRTAYAEQNVVKAKPPATVRPVPAKKQRNPRPKRDRPPSLGSLLVEAAKLLAGEFTFAQLCVAAWMVNSDRFGLDGYTHYPDSHAVAGVLYSATGPLAKGWIVKVSPGVFRLAATEACVG